MNEIIDIADLDCIFLTYDEPKKEEFWIHVSNMVPWAKRIDGIKGSDAAHKAAAAASSTDRFVLIDGDNIPDLDFFNQSLRIDNNNKDWVFRWKARNVINNLTYGNGGISCWTKDFVNNMRTHEASDGSADTCIEFCFDPKYVAMYNCYSTTFPNATPYQAWRAGFREGVKMCLNRGVKPSLTEFEENVNAKNYDNLSIWHNVGADVDNGSYAILGSRYGTWMTMFGSNTYDYTRIQDFDYLEIIFEEFNYLSPYSLSKIDSDLKTRLGLPILDIDKSTSNFFKYHYKKKHTNLDIMTTEMEVIRKHEGW